MQQLRSSFWILCGLCIVLFASPVWAGYLNNGNGTVTDTSTGLMWQQDTPNAMTWEQALSYCENSTLAGYTDWRLPTKKELRRLVDYSRYNPAINITYFPDTVSSLYFASTTYAYNTNYAWGVTFAYGNDYMFDKLSSYYVRAVRGGQSGSLGDSVILSLNVKNASTGDAIPGATVVVGSQSGQTNASGHVTISGLSTGQYNLQVSASGFTSHIEVLNLNQPGTFSLSYGLNKTEVSQDHRPVVTDVISYVSNRNKKAFFLNGLVAI